MNKNISNRSLILLFILGIPSVSYAKTEIYYNGNGVPDDAAWRDTFSTQVMPHCSWSSSGGELTLNTYNLEGIWFGNHPYWDTVSSWAVADYNQGNYLSARAKINPNSGQWDLWVSDTQFAAWIQIYEDRIEYVKDAWDNRGTYPLDAHDYHIYSILLKWGLVKYEVDGLTVYSGKAATFSSYKEILVGDMTAPSNTGWGSMVIDEVTIITEPNMFIEFPMNVKVSADPWNKICYGDTTNLVLDVVGGYPPYTYQWQQKNDPNWVDMGTASTQPVSPANTTQYRVRVTDSINDTIISEAFTLAVCQRTPDLNDDSCVNFLDFAILASQWLAGCD